MTVRKIARLITIFSQVLFLKRLPPHDASLCLCVYGPIILEYATSVREVLMVVYDRFPITNSLKVPAKLVPFHQKILCIYLELDSLMVTSQYEQIPIEYQSIYEKYHKISFRCIQ